jgi:hypothetical protein
MQATTSRYLRLRQVCLVAKDLEAAVDDLCTIFGIEVCHRDPNVAKYGLVNALMPVGTSFIEVVSPIREDTAAGRYLARRGGDGGYMAIHDCDDVGPYRERAKALGVRIIEDRAYPSRAHLLQLHPRDTGGCILEFDHHVDGERLDGAYQWAGAHWQQHVRTGRVTGILVAEVQADDPQTVAACWSALTGRPLASASDGPLAIDLDYASLRFAAAADSRGEGLGGVDLHVRDRAAILNAANTCVRACVLAEDMIIVCGTRFRLLGD